MQRSKTERVLASLFFALVAVGFLTAGACVAYARYQDYAAAHGLGAVAAPAKAQPAESPASAEDHVVEVSGLYEI